MSKGEMPERDNGDMALKFKIVFYHFTEKNKLVNEALKLYTNIKRSDVAFVKSEVELLETLDLSSSAIVVFKVIDKDTLKSLVTVLEDKKLEIKKGHYHFIGFTASANKKLEMVLKKRGVKEVLKPNINGSYFKYKIDFYGKSLRTKKITNKSLANEEQSAIDQEEQNAAFSGSKVTQVDAINHPGIDCWVINDIDECHFFAGRWIVNLQGPIPSSGAWVSAKKQRVPGQKTWKYLFRPDQKSRYVKERGDWYFSGDMPIYDKKQNSWKFSGATPALFYLEGETCIERFHVIDGTNFVAENSSDAMDAFTEETQTSYGTTIGSDKFKRDDEDEIPEEMQGGEADISGVEIPDSFDEIEVEEPEFETEEDDKPKEKISGKNLPSFDQKKKAPIYSGQESEEDEEVDWDQFDFSSEDFRERLTATVDLESFLYYKGEDNTEIKIDCRFEDFFGDTLVVNTKVELGQIKDGDEIGIYLTYDYLGADLKLDSLCKIEEISKEKIEDLGEITQIVLKVLNVPEDLEEKFAKIIEDRQEKIGDFMLVAKG